MVLKRTFVHTYVGGRKADLPREVGSTSEGKVNPTAQNAGFLLKELRQERAMYLSLPPTRHDSTQGQKPEGRLKWVKGEEKVGNELRLEPCLSVLLIGSLSAM